MSQRLTGFRGGRLLLVCASLAWLGGCAAMAQRAADDFADSLGRAVLDQDDPATVRDGLPAYLLLLDAMVEGNPDSPGALRSAAALYSSYAGSFVHDPERARRLSRRAFDYAHRATCLEAQALCRATTAPFSTFEGAVAGVSPRQLDVAYTLAGAWATRIQAHSEDMGAIADIPRVETLLRRVVELAPQHDRGLPWVYLGVLLSLRPEAVGGRPELGREAFERAIAESQGRNLLAKTLYARHYARLVFDQALHDRLLGEVLDADPHAEGFTLINTLAQAQARVLLEGSGDYF